MTSVSRHAAKPRLLVSVRDATEARAALFGGVDILDIKEPARGPLGRADNQTIEQIIQVTNGQRPVTAALGELNEQDRQAIPAGLTHVKIGLAGEAAHPDWQNELQDRFSGWPAPVAVAYADHNKIGAPDLQAVLQWCETHRPVGLLVDTAFKDGSTLLDHLSPIVLAQVIERVRQMGLFIALAGSLKGDSLQQVVDLQPDIVAVRSAACKDGIRDNSIDSQRVAEIKSLLGAHAPERGCFAG